MSLEKSPGKAGDPGLGPHPDLGRKKAKGPDLLLGLDQGNLLRGIVNFPDAARSVVYLSLLHGPEQQFR